MFERKVSDVRRPARAGGEAPETGDSGQEAGRDLEASARQVWPRAEIATPTWEGFGKALASTVLRQLKAQDGGAGVTSSITKSLCSIWDMRPYGEHGRHADLPLATSEQPDPGRRTIVDGSRELESGPDPELCPTDPGIVPIGLPPAPNARRVGDEPLSGRTSEPCKTSESFTRSLAGSSFDAYPWLGSGLSGTPREILEQQPRPVLSTSRDGTDGSPQAAPSISVHDAIKSIAPDMAGRYDLAGSSIGGGGGEVASNPPESRAPSIYERAVGVGSGGVARGAARPELYEDPPSPGRIEAGPAEPHGELLPTVGAVSEGRSPFVIDAGPARMTADYALDGATTGDFPVAAASPDPGHAMGAGPQGHGDSAVDITRTNQLLQQLLEEIKKGRRGFLPTGAREVYPGR